VWNPHLILSFFFECVEGFFFVHNRSTTSRGDAFWGTRIGFGSMMFLTRGDSFGSRSSCHPTLARRFSFFSLWTCRWIQDVTIIAWAARTLSQSLLFLFVFSLPPPVIRYPTSLLDAFEYPSLEWRPSRVWFYTLFDVVCVACSRSSPFFTIRNFSW
jgi:hypothetical protein